MRRATCEWKGPAAYWSLETDGIRIDDCAWSYAAPFEPYIAIANHLGFYPGALECYVAGERVLAQVGRFYGGWVTAEIAVQRRTRYGPSPQRGVCANIGLHRCRRPAAPS